jgi:hypothetical protein
MNSTGDLSWREHPWASADGRVTKLKDMRLGHLVNVLNWVNDLPGRYQDTTKELLLREAEYRKFIGFSGKKPYPERIDGKWFMFDPKTGLTQTQAPPKYFLKKAEKNKSYTELKEEVDRIRGHIT